MFTLQDVLCQGHLMETNVFRGNEKKPSFTNASLFYLFCCGQVSLVKQTINKVCKHEKILHDPTSVSLLVHLRLAKLYP